ncbi:MAG: hypothetical protein ACFFCM_08405 [Promethearchaeota archaeon]
MIKNFEGIDMEEKKSLIYWTRVKPLFKGVYEGAETKLNVAGAAVDAIIGYLEERITEALDEIVQAMPRKTKGEHEGELIRKTIKASDVRKAKTSHTKTVKAAEKALTPKPAPAKKKKPKKKKK